MKTREDAEKFMLNLPTRDEAELYMSQVFDYFEQQLKEKDEELEFTKQALLKASKQVVELEAEERNLHRDIEELKEVLAWKTDVINNFDKERKELAAKLKRYESPMYSGTLDEHDLFEYFGINVDNGVTIDVIVLEGGE